MISLMFTTKSLWKNRNNQCETWHSTRLLHQNSIDFAVRVSAPHPADNYHTCSVRRHSTKPTDSKTTTCDPCLGPRKNHYPNPTVTAMSFAVTLSPLFLSPSKPQLHFHNFPKFHPFQKIYPLRASRRSSNFSQVRFRSHSFLRF